MWHQVINRAISVIRPDWDKRTTVMKAVTEYGLPAVDDPARLASVHTLGAFTAAGPRRSTTFATGIVDTSGRPPGFLTWSPAGPGTPLPVPAHPMQRALSTAALRRLTPPAVIACQRTQVRG